MRLELTGRHIRITAAIRSLVTGGLDKLDRLLHDNAVSLQIVLSTEHHACHAEVTLHARGDHVLHASGSGRNWSEAVQQALVKVNRQARRLKERWTDQRRRRESGPKVTAARLASAPAPRDPAAGPRIVRARRYAVKPMTVEEAALEVGADRSAFIVFRNATTDLVNVLFRRPDGHLGLIEPDA
ncbi:MAG: ribosome-associated translation inhibitor RaiA [Vicinamibacterales bacterium]